MEITYTKNTTIPLDEIAPRLEAAAQKQQFGVLNIADLRSKMHAKGVDFKPACLIFDICNPKYAAEVLTKNMLVSTVLPCRISVYEDGGKLKLSTMLPTKVITLFGTDGLEEIARKVEEALIAIIDEACGV